MQIFARGLQPILVPLHFMLESQLKFLVQSWFDERKRNHNLLTPTPVGLKLFVNLSDANNLSKQPESSQKSKGAKISDRLELSFEAKSSRDHAWYDVAAFLSYRVLHTGELEARVRFAGFRNTDDEWVNVKKAVRERSIPLEASECHKEHQDQAIYCDADVVGVQVSPAENDVQMNTKIKRLL